MIVAAPNPPARTHLEHCLELTHAVRACVEEGRIDRLTGILGERETALRALRQCLDAVGAEEATEVASELDALRRADRDLMEWMIAEKEQVLRALQALHGQRVDPYGPDRITDPVALDQRR